MHPRGIGAARADGEQLPKAHLASWSRSRRRVLVALTLPALVVLFVVTVLPTLYLFATSFTPLDLAKPQTARFIGLSNYQELMRDDRFWNSVWVQIRLSFWTVSLQLLAGLGLAMLLNSRLRFLEALRSTFIIPMVLPPVVVALIWKILFTPDLSVLNWFLGVLGLPQPLWLSRADTALWAIIITDV